MNIKFVMVAIAVSSATLAPAIASADVWHQDDSEIGYSIHFDDRHTGKSRELETAKSDKQAWFLASRGVVVPAMKARLSREQVKQELEGMSDSERARLEKLYSGA